MTAQLANDLNAAAAAPVLTFNAADLAGPAALGVLSRLLEQACGALETDQATARRSLSEAVALLDAERRPRPQSCGGAGLAPWQAKRVAQAIEARMEDGMAVCDLAAVARLSVSHFSRAFKSTFGLPPDQYIASQRVARAQRMMLTTRDPLCQIAQACGFADQAHLSRVFRKLTGDTPHAWRRLRATLAA